MASTPNISNPAKAATPVNPVAGSVSASVPVAPAQGRQGLTIDVVMSTADVPCDFWVGLYKQGLKKISEVASAAAIAEVFVAAARDGIEISGPVMITDTIRQRPSYMYLMPPPATGSAANLHWVQTAMRNIKSWEPEYVGFYLAPELIDMDSAAQLLFEMIARYAETHSTRRFCLLVGNHGLHRVLNLALFLKGELERTQVKVSVFH